MRTLHAIKYRRGLMPAFFALAICGNAIAQTSDGRIANIVSGCGSGNCQNSLKGALVQLENDDLSVDQFSEQIGYFAMALYQVARTAEDSDVHRRVSMALRELAAAALLPEQQAAYIRVADAIDSGETELFDLDDPFSVSPS